MKFGQLLSVVLIAGLVGVATNVGYTYFTTDKPHPDEVKFNSFLDENWQDTMEKSPLFASLLGDKRYDDKISSNSIDDFIAESEYERYVLDVLNEINPNNLSEENQLNYRLLKSDYEINLEGRKYPGYYMRLNQRGGTVLCFLYGCLHMLASSRPLGTMRLRPALARPRGGLPGCRLAARLARRQRRMQQCFSCTC